MDPFDPRRLEALSRQEMIIELQDRVSSIIRALQIQGDPLAQHDTFQIDLEETTYKRPMTLLEQLGEEADFTDLRILIERGAEQPTSGVGLILERTRDNGTPMSVYLAHDTNTSDYMAELIVGNEDPVQLIEPVPRTEVNQMIASLIFPSKNGDYSAFDALDLTDVSVADNVSQALERSRNDYSVLISGVFAVPLDGKLHKLHFTEQDGELTDITITRQLGMSAEAVSLRLKNIGFDTVDDLLTDGVDSYDVDANGYSTEKDVTSDTLIQFIDFVRELRKVCASSSSEASEIIVASNDIETLADQARGSSEYRDANRRLLDGFVEFDQEDSDPPETE